MTKEEYRDTFNRASRCIDEGNYESAFRLFSHLSMVNAYDPELLYNLATCYAFGIGTEIDIPKGLKCYSKAVHLDKKLYPAVSESLLKIRFNNANDNAEAARIMFHYRVSLSYEYLTRAVLLYECSGVEIPNDIEFMCSVCCALLPDEIYDIRKSLGWAIKAYIDGNRDIFFFIKCIIEDCVHENVSINEYQDSLMKMAEDLEAAGFYDSAISIYKVIMSIIEYDEKIFYRVAEMLYRGIGCDKDTEKAVELFQVLLYHKSPYAQMLLNDTKFSEESAVNRILGEYYLYFSTGNNDKAMKHLKASYSRGDVKSMVTLGNVYMNGKVVPKDIQKGISFYEMAGRHGEVSAYYRLGMKYYDGEPGFEKNHNLSKEYMRRVVKSSTDNDLRFRALLTLLNIYLLEKDYECALSVAIELVDVYQCDDDNILLNAAMLCRMFPNVPGCYEKSFVYIKRSVAQGNLAAKKLYDKYSKGLT